MDILELKQIRIVDQSIAGSWTSAVTCWSLESVDRFEQQGVD